MGAEPPRRCRGRSWWLLALVIAVACVPPAQRGAARRPVGAPSSSSAASDAGLDDGWFLNRDVFRLGTNDAAWRDERMSAHVSATARRLERASGLPERLVDVSLTTCPAGAAKVYSGGWVSFCLPLALRVENDDEIAFVLAHEMSHVLLNHVPPKLDDAQRFAPSEEQETAADERGLEILVRAGYSPDAALSFLEKADVVDTDGRPRDASTSQRYTRAEALIESRYRDESDTRPATPLPPAYTQGARDARAHLAEVDGLYKLYLQVIEQAWREKDSGQGDAVRGAGCLRYYDAINRVADEGRYSELLIHAATVANFNCFYYRGTSDAYRRLIERHVDLRTTSLNALIALLLNVNVTLGTGLDGAIVAEMKRRLFAEPTGGPVLGGRDGERVAESYVRATFLETCSGLGSYDQEAAMRAYLTMTPAERQSIVRRMGGPPAFELMMNACRNAYVRSKRSKDEYLQEHTRVRVERSGNTPEQARAISEVAARVSDAGLYLSDMNAMADLVNAYARRR